MSVRNDKTVHPVDETDVEDDYSLNHLVDSQTRIQLRNKQAVKTDYVSRWRTHAFRVILPRKLSEHTDSDLKLMLVSLKNTAIATTVHTQRIERELQKRGSNLKILG